MKTMLPLCLSLLALTGCRSKAENASVASTPAVAQNVVQNAVESGLSESQRAVLQRFLSATSVEKVANDQKQWRTLSTDRSFAEQFRRSLPLMDTISLEAVKRIVIKESYNGCALDSLAEPLLVWKPGCTAECMEFMYDMNVLDLATVAKRTGGSADDEFVLLLKQLYGDALFSLTSPFISLFQFEWDYGGGSLSGNGESLKFLNQCKTVLSKSSLFKKEIETMESVVVNNFDFITYMEPKEKVQAEIRSVLDAKILPDSLTEKLNATLLRNETAPDSVKLQFNCSDENAGCDFGG